MTVISTIIDSSWKLAQILFVTCKLFELLVSPPAEPKKEKLFTQLTHDFNCAKLILLFSKGQFQFLWLDYSPTEQVNVKVYEIIIEIISKVKSFR